ncbi:MAG: leucyl aminopeptidase [Myxococcota bacterium]
MRFAFANDPIASFASDLLVVAVPAGKLDAALAPLGDFAAPLAQVCAEEEFTGKPGSSVNVPTYGRIAAGRILLVGAGSTLADLRQAAGTAGNQARARGAKSVALALGDAAAVRVCAEAFAEGNYRFDKYKPEASRKAPTGTLTFLGVDADADAIARAEALIAGQTLARDLVNEPAAEVYPESLANVALSLSSDRVSVEVWDEVKIREAGMGGITGVGQGSDRPPRFVHVSYRPAGPQRGHVALVGKGVTFDSGGLSLKPSDGMLTMRCDMAGAAAVVGTMKAIAAIQPGVRVDGIIGCVENMPSGRSYKLGDILKMYNGKRVEIHNTDAEGRLVLADCLHYASNLKPDAIVDLATLTGAAVVALGDWYSAVYSKTDDLWDALKKHADEAGEAVWRMPLPDLYRDKIKAEWGETKNTGGRAGGSITAALFLSDFVTCDKWAHVDIAGPAFLDSALLHHPAGATGTMVRTLSRWVESYGK